MRELYLDINSRLDRRRRGRVFSIQPDKLLGESSEVDDYWETRGLPRADIWIPHAKRAVSRVVRVQDGSK
jgi:hypothetical protein